MHAYFSPSPSAAASTTDPAATCSCTNATNNDTSFRIALLWWPIRSPVSSPCSVMVEMASCVSFGSNIGSPKNNACGVTSSSAASKHPSAAPPPPPPAVSPRPGAEVASEVVCCRGRAAAAAGAASAASAAQEARSKRSVSERAANSVRRCSAVTSVRLGAAGFLRRTTCDVCVMYVCV